MGGCFASSSGSSSGSSISVVQPNSSNSDNPIATFKCSMGEFEAEIFLDRVPITASNFIDLAQTGFYNDLHFHRVIPKFMCQFGCPNTKKDPSNARAGTGGPKDGSFVNLATGGKEARGNGGCIKDEFTCKDSNLPGTLSMANTGSPNSGGSQFFLNVAKNDFLDWHSGGASKHPVFGKINKNYELVVSMSQVKTNQDNPATPIKMESVTIRNLIKQ